MSVSPPVLIPSVTPIDLAAMNDSFYQAENSPISSFAEITFDHFFHSPSGPTEKSRLSAEASSIASAATIAENINYQRSWLGWSWSPPCSIFENGSLPAHQALVQPQESLRTPARHSASLHIDRISPEQVAPRSATRPSSRSRHLSERRDFQALLQCVHESARKRVPASEQRGARGSAGISMPLTPTPGYRSNSGEGRGVPLHPRSGRSAGSLTERNKDLPSHASDLSFSALEARHRSIETHYQVCDSLSSRRETRS